MPTLFRLTDYPGAAAAIVRFEVAALGEQLAGQYPEQCPAVPGISRACRGRGHPRRRKSLGSVQRNGPACADQHPPIHCAV